MVLKFTLGEILKLTHPLCPFITEKLWQENFKKEGSLMTEAFPKLDFKNQKSETEFINLQNLITQIRSLRAEKKLNPKEKLLVSTSIQSQEIKDLLQALAGINFGETDKEAVILIEANLEVKVQVPVDENRQTKEIEEIEKNISALKGRLSNKAYTEKAPAHLVQQTQDELNQAEETLKKLS